MIEMVIKYSKKYEEEWDNLVLNDSINGNFLQTRNFLNYHEEGKFNDYSLLFFKGEKLAAVLPGNEVENGQVLLSHQGSTFGGLVIRKSFASTTNYNWIFEEMMEHFRERNYEKVELRMPNWLYTSDDRRNELLDYYFHLNGFKVQTEVGFYIDLTQLQDDYVQNFDQLKRRKLKKAYKHNLQFRQLETDDEIKAFYDVLADNMLKFNIKPLHLCDDLLDFKNNRLPDIVSFYGVYYEQELIAGSMVFDFCSKKVFHTQYLASRHNYLAVCPNEFLYTNLIETAREQGYRFISFGTATLEHGEVYNENLGIYKEGFGTDTYVNKTYIRNFRNFQE